MSLISFQYAAFVAVAAVVFQLCPMRWRSIVLSVMSFLLYSLYGVASAAVLLVATAGVFGVARRIEQARTDSRRRFLLVATIILLLSYLLLMKLLPVWRGIGHAIPVTQFLVAIGVSYYTFKLMGYVIDVFWRKYPAWNNFALFSAFVAFFPQLPAGPIQRASEFSMEANGPIAADLMVVGLRRMLLGLVKKLVVADQLGNMVAFISAGQPEYATLNWVMAYLYAVQLYADFSALTDIAVGTAALFGVRSPENFAFPFFAPSMGEFWRRWHMTLTRWLTDYVFTPVRMSVRNLGRWGLALSITINMVLIGLWHGLTVGTLLFGLINAVYMIADSLTALRRRRFYRTHPLADRVTSVAGPLVVFHMVVFALVLFRAESVDSLVFAIIHLCDGLRSPLAALNSLFYSYGRARCAYAFAELVGFAVIESWMYLRSRGWKPMAVLPRFTELPRPVRWATYYAALLLVLVIGQQSARFIYVQF